MMYQKMATPRQDRPIRAAAYCRVSTMLEEQEGSYEVQMAYFRKKIEERPEMVLVGIYGDRGKSGLKTVSRKGLNQLLTDCKNGLIDVVLTKSVSRLARNMADCVDIVQKLRGLHVTICFENEGLRTNDPNCQLVLNLFAAIAQEESNSISQNVTRSHEQHAAEGNSMGRASYGYVGSGKDRWKINESEAKRVRVAFRMAAEGNNYATIMATLNGLEEKEQSGVVWQQKRLRRLLRNVVYLGDFYSHQTVCMSLGHQVLNRGYRDRYYLEGHHEPLVDKPMFDRVQKLMDTGMLVSYIKVTPEREKVLRDSSWKVA